MRPSQARPRNGRYGRPHDDTGSPRSCPPRSLPTADEVVGDVFDMLTALGDFDEFKSMMLAHRVGRNRGLAEVDAVGWRGMGAGEPQKARTCWETPVSVAGPKFSAAEGRVHGSQSKA